VALTPFLVQQQPGIPGARKPGSVASSHASGAASATSSLTPRFCIACRNTIPQRASFCPDCGIRQ